jgi:hypothetical protein
VRLRGRRAESPFAFVSVSCQVCCASLSRCSAPTPFKEKEPEGTPLGLPAHGLPPPLPLRQREVRRTKRPCHFARRRCAGVSVASPTAIRNRGSEGTPLGPPVLPGRRLRPYEPYSWRGGRVRFRTEKLVGLDFGEGELRPTGAEAGSSIAEPSHNPIFVSVGCQVLLRIAVALRRRRPLRRKGS